MEIEQRLDEIEEQIDEIKRSIPAHSIPAAMLLNLEELESERDRLLAEQSRGLDATT